MDIKRPSILQFESRMLRPQSRQSFRNFNFRMSAAWREHRGDHGDVRCALADEVFDRFTNTGSAEFVIGQRKEGAIQQGAQGGADRFQSSPIGISGGRPWPGAGGGIPVPFDREGGGGG